MGSSPSIDPQSFEEFSLQAESPSQSSCDEMIGDDELSFAYSAGSTPTGGSRLSLSWAQKIEKSVFNKHFDQKLQEAFLKSLNEANVFSPPVLDGGRSLVTISVGFSRDLTNANKSERSNDDETN
eukprot:TRINITY_DN1859_c0_g1_i1.p1 TRINITY_DN1859_c0_g1~~TRINITY_DN1859_c0_g1_i1.p1  ORF type:complete len:125 (+),score=23.11 TRINITY_DN1859_c0_g1_i1:48-422(+)